MVKIFKVQDEMEEFIAKISRRAASSEVQQSPEQFKHEVLDRLDLLEDDIKAIRKSDKKLVHNEIIENIKGLQDGLKDFRQEIDGFKIEVEEKVHHFEERAMNMHSPLVDAENSSNQRSRTKTSANQILMKKDSISIRYSTLEDAKDLSPYPNPVNGFENEFKSSMDIAYEDNEGEGDDVEQKGLNRDNTKSSKPATWNTNKINERIENFTSDDFKDIKHQIIELTQKIDLLRFTVKENGREIEQNREKLLFYMRATKGNISTQDRLADSIKQGIKQANKHSTSKSLMNDVSYFNKFQTPRDYNEKKLDDKNKSFFGTLSTRIVRI